MGKVKLNLPEGLGPQTPNEHKTALRNALTWLQQNPLETPLTAARRFGLLADTVRKAVVRGPKKPYGGQNRVLSPDQSQAIIRFIHDQLSYGILPTKQVVFGVICCLCKAQGQSLPSDSWFTKWWPKMGLHKIKAKPIAKIRIEAYNPSEIDDWFKGYWDIIHKYNIKRTYVDNFDESGFRVGCPRGVEVLVPDEVKEVDLTTIAMWNFVLVRIQSRRIVIQICRIFFNCNLGYFCIVLYINLIVNSCKVTLK